MSGNFLKPPHTYTNGNFLRPGKPSKPPVVKDPIDVQLSPKTLTLNEGEIASLSAIVNYTNAPSDSAVKWISKDESVATVDSNGKVTAIKKGAVEILAESVYNNSIYDTAQVTVSEVVTVSSVDILNDLFHLTLGGASEQATATVTYSDSSTDQDVSWSITDSNIASISATGEISPLKEGGTSITATANKDRTKTDTANVEVVDAATHTGTITPGRRSSSSSLFDEEAGYKSVIMGSMTNKNITAVGNALISSLFISRKNSNHGADRLTIVLSDMSSDVHGTRFNISITIAGITVSTSFTGTSSTLYLTIDRVDRRIYEEFVNNLGHPINYSIKV